MDNEDIDVYEKNEEPEIEIHQDNSYPTENFKENLVSIDSSLTICRRLPISFNNSTL